MTKRKNVILIIILSAIALFFINGNIDYSRVKNGKPPILSIPIRKDSNGDISMWLGFGYSIGKCHNDSPNSDDGKYKVNILSLSYVCISSFDVDIASPGDYTIIDKTKECDQALEEIERDYKYIYYLDCIKSNTVFLVYENGDKISVNDALATNRVSINELIDKGLKVYQTLITE